MKFLLVVILSSYALAEENDNSSNSLRRRLPNVATLEAAKTTEGMQVESAIVVEKTAEASPTAALPTAAVPTIQLVETVSHVASSVYDVASSMYDWTLRPTVPVDMTLPTASRPDICAEGTPGNYRPREETTNCARDQSEEEEQSEPMKAAKAELEDPQLENMVNDPRRPILPFQGEGYYHLQVQCSSDMENIDVWYQGVNYHNIDKQILTGWDEQHKNQDSQTRGSSVGFEPISAPNAGLDGPDSCQVSREDPCASKRIAACSINQKGINGEEEGDHDNLTLALAELMLCNMQQAKMEDAACDDPARTKVAFYQQERVNAAHLNTNMPNGLNLVPEGGGAGQTSPETEKCIDFALQALCKRGACQNLPQDECEKRCKEYRQQYQPRLIHQEAGVGVHLTNSNKEFVPHDCVANDATWISLLWTNAEPGVTPAKGAVTVFGCPKNQEFTGCGSAEKCIDGGHLPFQSWKGWITTAKISRSDFDLARNPFCTLWHQMEDLAQLVEESNWKNGENPTMTPDDEETQEYKALGYLQPQVCRTHEGRQPDPMDKCVNLSPDNCHFRKGTNFDTQNGQFYHQWNTNWRLQKWWFPRFSDKLDWKEMLPVCFGCDHESCGAEKDIGKGTCSPDLHHSQGVGLGEDRAGPDTWAQLLSVLNQQRSPAQRMAGNTSGQSVVRDQGGCGSCWAFASMTTVSHLTCIADCKQNGRCLYDNIILGNDFLDPWQASAQQILSCNSQRAGCNGGWMRYGDEVYQNFGVMKEKNFPCDQAAAKDPISGALAGMNAGLKDSCKDYYNYACKTGNCRSTVNADDGLSTCTGGSPAAGAWDTTTNHNNICQNQWGAKCPYSWDYHQYPATSGYSKWTGVYNVKRVNVGGWYNVASGSNWEADYKNHLYHTGPFGVAFDVYTDFPWNGCSASDDPDHVYTVGSSASKRGGHGVTMVGYGWAYNTCGGTAASTAGRCGSCTKGWMKYWLLQNSWGRNWGQGGYWKHRRGTDEARIESWAATAPEVEVNCNEKNKYYGGRINYPKRTRYIKTDIGQGASPEVPSWMKDNRPEAPESDKCKASEWRTEKATEINGFKIIHSVQDLSHGDAVGDILN